MSNCQQCGKCCLGLEWTFSFKAKDEDPKNPSEEVLEKAEKRMKLYGLLYHEFKRAKLRENMIDLTYKVGACQHLKFVDNKAFCENHDKRPIACKDYFCEKSKKD
jgi:Fe-S-cluster containining protein